MGDRFANIDMGYGLRMHAPYETTKVGDGGLLWPFSWGRAPNSVAWAEVYLRTKWHLDTSNRLATIHQRYRQTDRQTHRRA